MRKLKFLGCFAVLKCHIFVGTRKKTKQCFRLARLFDAVTAKRGLFKTVLGSTLLCLSIANTGGGDVVLTDGEKAVCLSYGYKYGVADIFFPVVGKEAFHCKEIDLKTVSDIIKNRNSKDAPKVYVWY